MNDVGAPEAIGVPASHRDLLTRPGCGVLTTMDAEGQPQSSLVRVDLEADEHPIVNAPLPRPAARNMAANRKVSLLVVDPDNTARFIQIRGDAELWRDERRVICRIRARRITLDAIHA